MNASWHLLNFINKYQVSSIISPKKIISFVLNRLQIIPSRPQLFLSVVVFFFSFNQNMSQNSLLKRSSDDTCKRVSEYSPNAGHHNSHLNFELNELTDTLGIRHSDEYVNRMHAFRSHWAQIICRIQLKCHLNS